MLGIVIYLLLAIAPSTAATLVHGQLLANGPIHYAIAMSGNVALTMIPLQFIMVSRIKWIENAFGFSAILRFHKSMAIVVTFLVFGHVGLLVWSRGDWFLIVNVWESWPIQSGRVAAVALLVILGFSFGRKLIPINNSDWRWFHNVLAWTILVSGLLHSIALQSRLEVSFVWTGYFSIAILAWSRRWCSNNQSSNA